MFGSVGLRRGFIPDIVGLALAPPQGVISGTKFGRNTDVDGAEDIVSQGGDYSGQPLVGGSMLGIGEVFEVLSDDANDTSAGTGCQRVRISYLDDDGHLQEAETDTNGTSGASFGVSGIRCFRVEGIRYGSGEINAGELTVRHSITTSQDFAHMTPGVGQSEIAAITTPLGYRGVIYGVSANIDRNSSITASISVRVRPNMQNGFSRKNVYRVSNDGASHVDPGVVVVPELTDIKLRVEEISTTNGDVAGQFNYCFTKA